MKRKKIEVVIYVVLTLLLGVFVFFAVSSALEVNFAMALQKSVAANTAWKTFDIFAVAEWGMVITTAILVILLVIFDERVYRRRLRNK